MKFKPSWLSSLVLAALAITFTELGRWQLDRAQEKRQLETRFDQADTRQSLPGDGSDSQFMRLDLSGSWDGQRHFLLDNQVWKGRAGVHVLTPFQDAASGRWLLVNRGWLPLSYDRLQLPQVVTPAGPVDVSGHIQGFPSGGLRLGEAEPITTGQWPKLMTYPEHDQFATALGLELSNWVLYLAPDSAGGFDGREWKPTRMGPEKHQGYALQWFALALTAVVAWLILGVKRARELKA